MRGVSTTPLILMLKLKFKKMFGCGKLTLVFEFDEVRVSLFEVCCTF